MTFLYNKKYRFHVVKQTLISVGSTPSGVCPPPGFFFSPPETLIPPGFLSLLRNKLGHRGECASIGAHLQSFSILSLSPPPPPEPRGPSSPRNGLAASSPQRPVNS